MVLPGHNFCFIEEALISLFSSRSSPRWANAALLRCGTIVIPTVISILWGHGGKALAEPPPTVLPPPDTKRIAFVSNRDGNFEIYSMKPDGQDVKRLTDNAGTDQKPVWSRDHSKIAWVSDRDGNFEIYSQNVVNGEAHGLPVRLTDNAARDAEPSWSPDGKQLVFTSNRDGQRELYVLDVAGNSTRRLTQRPGNEDYSPAWSPQGDKIAFQSQLVDTGQFRGGIPSYIYTVSSNGEDIQKVTNGFFDTDPTWHPNGSKIAFWRSIIMAVDLSNGAETVLSPDGYISPSYSPDGQHVVCVKGVSEGEHEKATINAEIFVLNANEVTDEPRRITNNLAYDGMPAW